MLALLTTHRVTRAVLVLVVCVCSIRLAGPSLRYDDRDGRQQQRHADAAVDPRWNRAAVDCAIVTP